MKNALKRAPCILDIKLITLYLKNAIKCYYSNRYYTIPKLICIAQALQITIIIVIITALMTTINAQISN